MVADRVDQTLLPPALKPGAPTLALRLRQAVRAKQEAKARAALRSEVALALQGQPVRDMRPADNGRRVVCLLYTSRCV